MEQTPAFNHEAEAEGIGLLVGYQAYRVAGAGAVARVPLIHSLVDRWLRKWLRPCPPSTINCTQDILCIIVLV